MIYPNFLKKNDTIGISALSAGVGKKLDDYQKSLDILAKYYKIKETNSVRNNALVSNVASIRAKELDELVLDEEVKMIMCAAGGDGQIETLPYINYEHIKKHPKWLMGASDPTNLLFPVTTMLDIATIYGFNGGSYYGEISEEANLSILSGNIIKQFSYPKYKSFIDAIKGNEKYHNVYYKGEIETRGRIIGGCIDCIAKIIGTKYDYVNSFIDKYQEDGIIWYFDNFALSAFDMYLTLLQFKNAGYFRKTKAILFGRIAFANTENSEYIKDYNEAYKKALDDIPYISEMDIGHTRPTFTIINGSIANIKIKDGQGEISQELI